MPKPPKEELIDIPKLDEDEEYAPAQRLLRAFEGKLADIDREIEKDKLEEYLRHGNTSGDRNTQIAERLKGLKAVSPSSGVTLGDQIASAPPAVARGLELLRGCFVSRIHRLGRLKELERDRKIIGEAIGT